MAQQDYKKWHKPVTSDKAKFHQGYFHPMNPEKCLSNENIYRSSWEQLFMTWCDRNPSIVRWASEPIGIPYKNPVKNIDYCRRNNLNPNDPRNWGNAMYYTDFWAEIKDEKTGNVKKYFFEVKPHAQTLKPKPILESAPLKDHKKYKREAETYLVNVQKWAAAKKYFNERGCEFMIITEKTLHSLGLL